MRSSSMRFGRRLRCTSSPCAIAGLVRGSEQRTRAAAREREPRGALSYTAKLQYRGVKYTGRVMLRRIHYTQEHLEPWERERARA